MSLYRSEGPDGARKWIPDLLCAVRWTEEMDYFHASVL